LRPAKGPDLGICPKATTSDSMMGQTTTHAPRGLLQMQPDGTLGKKTSFHLARCQDAIHNVARMSTGGSTAPLCLHKVGQSSIPIPTRLKASRTSRAWHQKTDVALGPLPPSRSPRRGQSPISAKKKKKTILFTFKILIKVNFKIQVTK
jgi:hypothetical protein